MERKLRRIVDGKHEWLGGVCAGIAYWLGCPTWLVRLIWFAVIFGAGTGLFFYILLWIFMPKWEGTPEDYKEVTGS